MTLRKRMPACQHVEIGGNLQTTRDYLIHLSVNISNTYGKTSRQAKAADKALRAVDELRNVLDDVSAAELPGDGWSSTIYYGANGDVRQVEVERVMEVHWRGNPECCAQDHEGVIRG